jgi:hypothetical protein
VLTTQSRLRVLAALVLFGVAFGYVEAAVVVYLRSLYEPLHQQRYPERSPGDLFPYLGLERLTVPGMDHVDLPATELWREAATLALLAAVALAVARNIRQWLAAFVVGFGLWDIFYYVFLAVLIDWPRSLLDWDVLFLVPVPWSAPVLAPVIVALTMVLCGAAVLWREGAGRPLVLAWRHWLGVTLGGAALIVAFCWDHRNVEAGGRPAAFHWPLFTVGLGLGLATFLHAWRGITPGSSEPRYPPRPSAGSPARCSGTSAAHDSVRAGAASSRAGR